MHYIFVCLLILAFGTITSANSAEAASLPGAWRGGGVVKLNSGAVEKIRCRVSYEKSLGKTFVFHANCSTTAGMISQRGRVVQLSGSRYRGRLYNSDYNVTATVKVTVSGRRQIVTATSSEGSIRLTLRKR